MSDSCILRVSPQQQEQTGNSLGFFVAIISIPSTFTQISSSSDPISKTGELCGLHTRGVHTVVICLLIGFIYAFFSYFSPVYTGSSWQHFSSPLRILTPIFLHCLTFDTSPAECEKTVSSFSSRSSSI